MKPLEIRLWFITALLALAVVMEIGFDPAIPVMLIPMGLNTLGMAVYGGAWTIAQIWRKNRQNGRR